MPALQAFGASLSLLLEIGPEAVSKRILEQAESVRELARKLGWTVAGSQRPEEQGGIVAIEKAGILPDDVARRGREVQVVLSSRRGRVRISPHVYNDTQDFDRLGELLGSAP